MNILPLVFAFVIMLALGSYSIFQDLISCKSEEKNYCSYMKTHRILQTNFEKKQFTRSKGKLTYGQQSRTATSKDTRDKYSNPRDKITLHPFSKLNLLPLIAKGVFPQSPEFYEIAATLIRVLYQNTSIYSPGLEYKVLDLLIEEGKNEEKISAEALTAGILKRDQSLYKVFKGTKKYTVLTKEGYPPLFDFINIEAGKSKKPVHFHYATTPILLALFGENITASILKMEKEKWEKDPKHSTLTPQELETLRLKELKQPKTFELEALIDFSQKNEPNPNFTVIDNSSGISIRTKI